MTDRFADAIARIDAANAEDPNVERVDGRDVPKELVYGQRMSTCLDRFAPNASEALRLAARAQHIRRFEIPRSEYPDGRAGYHRWRTELMKRHAAHAREILEQVGYDEETIARVEHLVRKRDLKRDAEVQTLEDVICLVFLEHYWSEFAAKHDEEKLIVILQKTWAKMSPDGHAAALALPLSEADRALVAKALGA